MKLNKAILSYCFFTLVSFFGQAQLPLSISVIDNNNTVMISIKDSTDRVIAIESVDSRPCSNLLITLNKDTVITFNYPVWGHVEAIPDSDNIKVKKIIYQREDCYLMLLIYFEKKGYGSKMYYLNGEFASCQNGVYADFIPFNFNCIKSGTNDYSYFFNSTESLSIKTLTRFGGKAAQPMLFDLNKK